VELDKAICGEDEGCLEELAELPSFLKELDEVARRFQIEASPGVKPLIRGVDVEAARAAAGRHVSGEFVDYLIRRALYFRYGGGEWTGRCAVCGEPATLVVLRRTDFGIYEGYRAEARCICGSTWNYAPWKCPKCGAEGREHFEVYILNEAKVLRCRKCGHVFGEVEDVHEESLQTLHLKLLMLIMKISGAKR
jgi:FdhE protein